MGLSPLRWLDAELAPIAIRSKTAPTFAELFDGTRDGLRRLAEGWHQARGATPTEYLGLFASLTAAEEIEVVRKLRKVKPGDGEPMEWIVSRRAIAVQQALDGIQEARGLPPIMPGPPPGGYPVSYVLTEGDRLEALRIAKSVVKFFGPSTPAVTVRSEVDHDGWHWVRVCDVDGDVLKMGTGGVQIGAVQCGHEAEADAMAVALREAIDAEARRVAVDCVRLADVVTAVGSMPKHIARRLAPEPAATEDTATPSPAPAPAPAPEEVQSCGYRR